MTSVAGEDAANYFGFIGLFFAMDAAIPSERTRMLLGWEPTGPTPHRGHRRGRLLRLVSRARTLNAGTSCVPPPRRTCGERNEPSVSGDSATGASPTGTSDPSCSRARPVRSHQFSAALARPSYNTVNGDSFKIAVIRAPRASQLPGVPAAPHLDHANQGRRHCSRSG